jgi:lysophospholipase L1-like esterase
MIGRRRLLGASLLAAPVLAAAGKVPLAATAISRLGESWWRLRHEAKLADLRGANPTLLWLGDSITQNFERDGPDSWAKFRPIWQGHYAPLRAVNLGFSGDATSHLLWRLRNGELDGVSPRAAIVLIGANNLGRLHWSAEDTLAGISAVLAECRARQPAMRVLLLGVLPSERSDWASQTTAVINAGLAQRHHDSRDVTFLDTTSVFLTNGAVDRSHFYDPLLHPPQAPLHPTSQAQERLCAFIAPALQRLLA